MPSKAKNIYWAVRRVWNSRNSGQMLAAWENQTGDRVLPDDHFETMVYYADGVVNMYQLRQWYEPLKALNEQSPVVLVCRSVSSALALLEESPVPVVYGGRIEDIENLVNRQRFKTVLYVNQNTRNFQMMRFATMLHVFISHGESDKSYMTSGQMKCYDYAFIAGDAAANRLSQALMGYDVPSRTKRIGRPQLDTVASGGVPLPDDDRTVVFYAPTWEGDRPSMSYGSLASHGVAMTQALLASGRHRLIVRSHPRTGVVSAEHKAASDEIAALIAQANLADPSANHVFDQTPTFDWQLQAADLCITDVSAAALDWLATGKPLIVTKPASRNAVLPDAGYLATLDLLPAKKAGEIVAVLDEVSADTGLAQEREKWVTYYFGDTTPGAPTAAFLQACRELREERDRLMAELPAEQSPGNSPSDAHREITELEEIEFES
ncbi:MAG: CDP-glycerol glycerophosphotransferase family protein [Candidatus Nanopelagicales bacterium]|nr:CDP-glycerol glycerophosphotransferase family protein [Candidatus Nanopelagicales bacterium]